MKTIEQLRKAIETAPARSAWSKGVKLYALELLEELPAEVDIYISPLTVIGALMKKVYRTQDPDLIKAMLP